MLEAHERSDETFSDVVLRLAGERLLLEFAGFLNDEEAAALECCGALDFWETSPRRGEDLISSSSVRVSSTGDS